MDLELYDFEKPNASEESSLYLGGDKLCTQYYS